MRTGRSYFVAAIILVVTIHSGFSQPNLQNWCGTDYFLQKKFSENPAARAAFDQYNRKAGAAALAMRQSAKKSGALQIIPVVVHVLHDNGIGNISKAQIESGLAVLNRDFRRLNADTGQTRALFKPHAADSEFEFRLAKIDPNGNCTEGIVRVNTTLTYNASDQTGIKSTAAGGSSPWPINKYLNIWLVQSIESGGSGGIILGYAILPGSWGWTSDYGTVIRNDYFGTMGTSVSDGRTATHEVGHCLGLLHTFDSGCEPSIACNNGGDYICDTPPSATNTFGCNSSQNSCSNDVGAGSPYTTDVVDQIENYLSYDACQNMFSLDQKSYMKYTVSYYSQLVNLTSSANLIATGTNPGYVAPLCTPIADFYAQSTIVCSGIPVQFYDISYNGSVANRLWSFTGGTPSSSTDSAATVTYYFPGTYNVTLYASNASGSDSEVKSSYITVIPSPLKTLPYAEGFENTSIPGNEWTLINSDLKTWELTATTSYEGGYSLRMNNYGNASDRVDEIISPPIDFSVVSSGVNLSFYVAYVQRTSTSDDSLKLYISADCGETWYLRFSKTGASLATAPLQSPAFIPSDSTQWKKWTVSAFSSMFYTSDFRYKFRFTSGGGNYLYIDNINIAATLNAIPVLVSPFNFSEYVTMPVLLDWNAVASVDSYHVQVDIAPDFTSPSVINISNTYLGPSNNGTDTEYPMNNLSSNTDYWWRARTFTAGTPSAWSSVWTFRTDSLSGYPDIINPPSFTAFPGLLRSGSSLTFTVSGNCTASLRMADITGRSYVLAMNREWPASRYSIRIPHPLSPGLYILLFETSDQVFIRKIVVE